MSSANKVNPTIKEAPHKHCWGIVDNKLVKLYISHVEHFAPVSDFDDEAGHDVYACWHEPVAPMSLVGTTKILFPVNLVLLPDAEHITIPVKASAALLHSMAVRYDHSLGISEGVTDDEIIAMRKAEPIMAAMYRTSREREGLMTTMKQLHEEVVGKGFYNYEGDTH